MRVWRQDLSYFRIPSKPTSPVPNLASLSLGIWAKKKNPAKMTRVAVSYTASCTAILLNHFTVSKRQYHFRIQGIPNSILLLLAFSFYGGSPGDEEMWQNNDANSNTDAAVRDCVLDELCLRNFVGPWSFFLCLDSYRIDVDFIIIWLKFTFSQIYI